jgi:hypothetical protein
MSSIQELIDSGKYSNSSPKTNSNGNIQSLIDSGEYNKPYDLNNFNQLERTNVGLTGLGTSQYDANIAQANLPNLQQIRANRQSGLAQMGNALGRGVTNGILTALETTSYILDAPSNIANIIEGKAITSNYIADLAKEGKEAMYDNLPIYRKNNELIDFSDSGFYWDAFSSVVDSAVGFGLTGMGAGAAVKGLGSLLKIANTATKANRVQWMANRLGTALQEGKLGTTSTALLQNYGEATMMGLETYESTYNHSLTELVDNFKKSNNNREPNEEELKRLASLASAQAGKAANNTFLLNQLFFVNNAVQLNALGKGARGLVDNPSIRNFLKAQVKNAPLEGLEEIGQSVIGKETQFRAEEELKDIVNKNKQEELNRELLPEEEFEFVKPVSFESDTMSRLLNFATSEQALLEGAMGLISGPIQYSVTQLPFQNFQEQKEQYNKQQDQIQKAKEFFDKKNKQFISNQDLKAKLVEENYTELHKAIADKEFIDLALENIGIGTDSQLTSIIQEKINNPEVSQEEKEYHQNKLKTLSSLKQRYNQVRKYGNPTKVLENELRKDNINTLKIINNELVQEKRKELEETLGVYVDNYNNNKKADTDPEINTGQIIDEIMKADPKKEFSFSNEVPIKFTELYTKPLRNNNAVNFLVNQKKLIPQFNEIETKIIQDRQELTDANAQQPFVRLNTIINSTEPLEGKIEQVEELEEEVKKSRNLQIKSKLLNAFFNSNNKNLYNELDNITDSKKLNNFINKIEDKSGVYKDIIENTGNNILKNSINKTKNELLTKQEEEQKALNKITDEGNDKSVAAKKQNVKDKKIVVEDKQEIPEQLKQTKKQATSTLLNNGNEKLANELSELTNPSEIDAFIKENQEQINPEDYQDVEADTSQEPAITMDDFVEESPISKEVKTFAKDISEGTSRNTPEDQQFYENNKKEIEQELSKLQNQGEENVEVLQQSKSTSDEILPTNSVTKEVNNTLVNKTKPEESKGLPDVKVINDASKMSKALNEHLKFPIDRAEQQVEYKITETGGQSELEFFKKNFSKEYKYYQELQKQVLNNKPLDDRLLELVAEKIPIRVVFSELGEQYWTRLFPPKEGKDVDAYTAEMQLRKQILINLLNGSSATGIIKGQYGGELKTEETNKNINQIPDFENIDVADIKIMYSDDKGLIRNTNGEWNSTFNHIIVEHNNTPLGGAIFTEVSKLNGEKFPLKINVRKHTTNERTAIKELYREILSDKDKENNVFGKPIKQSVADLLPKELIEYLQDGKQKLPTYSEVLSHLVYEGEDSKKNPITKLYVEKGKLYFGGNSVGSTNFGEKLDELTAFLKQFKAPNINIRKIKADSKYKEFIINNGYLLTDAVIEKENKTLFTPRTEGLSDPTKRHLGGFVYVANEVSQVKPGNDTTKDKLNKPRKSQKEFATLPVNKITKKMNTTMKSTGGSFKAQVKPTEVNIFDKLKNKINNTEKEVSKITKDKC